ncbi:nucleotide sugar dehydrogenase [Spirosoma taeanense]|uniref:Nucleotide sugar dehydrogenase n=1 Tax=Spirosoma taeanense TaxID=2735870 RepID=A0A6M5YB39_9BACT|nr:nucleotide sugar dehydrogenase [Spirosoma taeanense]QJW91179.1 nucleotide sugar dehydrogenase [Spirosoma taeanense]
MQSLLAATDVTVGIIGLGYVGLPLALEFGKQYETVGFDVDQSRVDELQKCFDRTRETDVDAFRASRHIRFTTDPAELKTCTVFIVTVPTPIDHYKKPDLSYLLSASRTVGKCLKPGDVVVYESTVYPGCTEEECVPVLEKYSGLRYNVDFFCGYSPERINPGDKERTLTRILKITSGSTPQVADFVNRLYGSVIEAGTYKAPSIKVAEAAKAIENAQRDVNISFVNELALIFDRMGIDTMDVLEAAGTKWNFLNFKPGLVGGHCISVDPYYLAHKAQSLGYHPQVILSGRRVNDDMPLHVANKLVKKMSQHGIHLAGSKVLLLGITFKENCPDIRNSKVADIYHELRGFGIEVQVYDPWAVPQEVHHEFGIRLIEEPEPNAYDGIILAVAHKEFQELTMPALTRSDRSVVYDLKAQLDRSVATLRI